MNRKDELNGVLRIIRYEDAANNVEVPPVPDVSINPPPRAPLSPSSPSSWLRDAFSVMRTRSYPTSPTTTLSEDDLIKRDSGIDPSVSTANHVLHAESQQPSAAGEAAQESVLPTIVVHENESPAPISRIRSPFGSFGRNVKEKARLEQLQSQSPPPGGIGRFKAIPSSIHTESSHDFQFEDLATDKVGFSHRGSLLFGGQKMDHMVATQGDGNVESMGTEQPVGNLLSKPNSEAITPVDSAVPIPDAIVPVDSAVPSPGATATMDSDLPSSGLVTGRRKPSLHMLRAALQGGRVLSAEEIGLSLKVRNMYEHGDESGGKNTPESMTRESSMPDMSINGILVEKVLSLPDEQNTPHRQKWRASASYSREPHEFAGGIEDWEDVEGRDVDRYGFISPSRAASRQSITSQKHGEGIHRVATALRLEAEQPRRERKLQRGTSTSRSARSVPAKRSESGTLNKGPGSMRSFRSGESRQPIANPFQSRKSRTLAQAPDMLTLPPGLADVVEQGDTGRAAASIRRREVSRDEKWQKMARAERAHSDNIGGGMQFEFDTSDPKLINRTWKGIPDRWRASAWHSFLSTSAKRRGNYASDEELGREYFKLQEMSAADDVQIDVDVPRTINMHIMFRRRYRGGQRLLFRVLHAISLYCPESGYVQGMASLAATLLCYYDEERAFVMMVRLWQLRGLEHLFQSEFTGLLAALSEFESDWLRDGDVAHQLEELSIPSTSYGTRWYLTLFNLSLPFPAQLRIWDVFMLLGDAAPGKGQAFGGADLDVLHAASAALIDATRDIILEADFETAMKVLTSFIPIKDEDLLMRVAMTEYKLRKKRAGTRL